MKEEEEYNEMMEEFNNYIMKEEEEKVGDEAEGNEERRNGERMKEEEEYNEMMEKRNNYIMKEEEEDDGRMEEEKHKGEEEHMKKEEEEEEEKEEAKENREEYEKEEEHYAIKKMEERDDGKKEEENKIRFPSLDDEDEVFADDDETSNTSITEAALTETDFDSTSSSPLPPPSSETPQEPPSRHSTSFTPDSILESYTTDANSEIRSPAMDEEEDLSLKFFYPPNLSRLGTLGSIYSDFSPRHSCGDSSSEFESDTCAPPCMEGTKDCNEGLGDPSEKGKEVMGTDRQDGQDGQTFPTERNSSNAILSNAGSVKRSERNKIPPPKPPRLRMQPTTRDNEDKRRSREDPIRYIEASEGPQCTLKRSTSMVDILESSLEASDDLRCSASTQSPKEKVEVAGEEVQLRDPDRIQDSKKHRRNRSGGLKIKDAAKIVTSMMSKGQILIQRKDAVKLKNITPKKTSSKDTESPPSSPPPPPPPTSQDIKHDASQMSQMPKKPPRKDLNKLSADSLDKAQGTCGAHGALLHFYCAKCRVVVCRDCTVVAHSHSEDHKVLDTRESLDTLRSEAVAMLRHYTILETMHASLAEIYSKFKNKHRDADITAIGERLEEGKYLAGVVKEAEYLVETWTNLEKIRERVRQWEARQDEWGDLVFLALRCSLLADMRMPYDTVLLRMGNWVMPTPWIQLSHLLQPYLRTSPPPHISPSSKRKDDVKHNNQRGKGMEISPHVARKWNGSPYGGGGTNTGGTDLPFPHNARQTVLSNLVPYIILNPHIRYFVHIRGPRDVDLTLVIVPTEDHAHDCLKQRRNIAIRSPAMLRQANYRPTMDAITLVEQQMTCGPCRTRFTASSMPLGPSATPTIVKVSFCDVKILSDGHGLPLAKDGIRRGDVIVDHRHGGRPALTVAVRDIGDFPALRLGRVTWGMDGLTCLVGTEETRRAETSGFRAKIKATVKREEETVYDVMFGMDL